MRFTEGQIQDALAVVGQQMAKDYGIRVQWTDGKRVCADIHRKVVTLPRLSCASTFGVKAKVAEAADIALNTTRSNSAHEFGHCAYTKLEEARQPKGAKFSILNALEDVRIERKVADSHPGYGVAFRWSNERQNKKIAGEVLDGKVEGDLWLAMCGCIFQSQGISPAWTFQGRAKQYFDRAYPTFVQVLCANSTEDCLELAEKIFADLKDLLKEERDEKKKQQQEQQKQQSKKQSKKQKGGEEQKEKESGSEGQSDEQEQDGEEQESGEEGESESSGGEESDEDGEPGKNESEAGSESDEDEDEDEEDGQGKGESESEDEADGEGEADADEKSEDEGTETGKGKGKKDDKDEAGDEAEGKPGAGKGDESENEADESDDDGEGEDGEDETDEEAERKAEEEAEKQLDADAEGKSLSERANDELEQAIQDLEKSGSVYTSRRDTDHHRVPVIDDYGRQNFSEISGKMQAEVAAMVMALEQALRAITRCRKEQFLRSGRLDNDRLVEIAKNLSKNIFYQRHPGKELSTAVTLIVDQSGSMGNIGSIRDLCIMLGECLSRLNIPFEVIGTTTQYMGGCAPSLDGFSRTNPIVYDHYKTFEEVWPAVRERLMAMTAYKHNIDGEAVEFAASRVAGRHEARKIVFSLCDGDPCGGQNNNAVLATNITRVAETARKQGIEVYGVGLNCTEPGQYYGEENFIYIEGDEHAGQQFVKAFAGIITKGAVRV